MLIWFDIFSAFEDEILEVHQIPIFPPELQLQINNSSPRETHAHSDYLNLGLQNSQQVDVAFFVQLKPALKVWDIDYVKRNPKK